MLLKDVFIHYLEHAPAGFHGFVTHNADDSYSVFLDPNDSIERRSEAYLHELKHIDRNDLDFGDVEIIELLAHKKRA